jgi:transcriptional regulator with XRE-family HTH domain
VAADPLSTFGANLRRLRQNAGLSQEELGLRAGIALSNISTYEAGGRNATILTLVRLARALGARPADLLRDIE